MADPYSVLGVSRTADSKEIRKAYRALAKRFHPDRNKSKSAEDRFKSINAAYDVVGDEQKRKLYDEFGGASLKAGFDMKKINGVLVFWDYQFLSLRIDWDRE